jgi:hypothetical protein
MTRRNDSRRWLVALTVAVAAVQPGCGPSQDRNPHRERIETFEPLGWTSGGLLVLRRVDQNTSNRQGVLCDSTGVYYVSMPETARVTTRRVSEKRLCQLLWQPLSYNMGPDSASLLYGGQAGVIAVVRFSTSTEDTIVSRCLPRWSYPAASADGQLIAYSASCSSPEDRSFLNVARIDGSDPRPLGAAAPATTERSPTWSPDGRQIAFVSRRTGAPDSIAVVVVATGQRRRIAEGTAPSWGPSAEWVAYLSRDRNGRKRAIRVIHPDGTGDHVVVTLRSSSLADSSHAPHWISSRPIWSPDGQYLVFAAVGSLWRVAEDGSRMRRIL